MLSLFVTQYVEGMKLLSYELMDVMKEMEGSSMPEERVLCHYESCASQLVMELVYKVHMVGLLIETRL